MGVLGEEAGEVGGFGKGYGVACAGFGVAEAVHDYDCVGVHKVG